MTTTTAEPTKPARNRNSSACINTLMKIMLRL
jgi:hypothetical protein